MPQSEGGYVSLDNGVNSVYNTTTEPSTGTKSYFESVKRVIGHAIGNNGSIKDDLLMPKNNQPIIVSAR